MRTRMMKTSLLPILLALLFVTAGQALGQVGQPATGRFRVTLTGFRVNHETIDSAVSIDGAGDEVFAVVNFAELWSSNNIFGALQRRQSLTYGDTNGRLDPLNPTRILPELNHPGAYGTIQAGSMSTTGGLKSGDSYPPSTGPVIRPNVPEAARARLIPMVLWEGELRRGGQHPNAIVLLPTIWESDNVTDVLDIWNRQVDSWIRHFAANNSAAFVNGTSRRSLVEQVDNVLTTIPQRNDFDRPIGMSGGAFNPLAASPAPATFIPAVMFLTFDSAEAAANSTTQGRGVVEITYRDGQSYGPGNYTIFLLVERLP